MTELKDTVALMNSNNYKERFKAEYLQTKIRYEKLKAFNNKIEAARRTEYARKRVDMPAHDCPEDLLREQQAMMGQYLYILEVRAVIEGVELEGVKGENDQSDDYSKLFYGTATSTIATSSNRSC